jgi:hypothetical protein
MRQRVSLLRTVWVLVAGKAAVAVTSNIAAKNALIVCFPNVMPDALAIMNLPTQVLDLPLGA